MIYALHSADNLPKGHWFVFFINAMFLFLFFFPQHLCYCLPDEPLTPPAPSNTSMPSYCRNEEGDIFLAAESWKPNVCSSCVCADGVISCFSESCLPVNCARPVLRKGQCCPYCLGTNLTCNVPSSVCYTRAVSKYWHWRANRAVAALSWPWLAWGQSYVGVLNICFLLVDATPRAVCHFNGKTYVDEERWDIDSCTHCYCLQGQTLCSTVSCPALPCHQPVTVEGSCCPLCPGQLTRIKSFMMAETSMDSQIHFMDMCLWLTQCLIFGDRRE